MPYQTPSASQFIQIKRLQSTQTANVNTDPLKFRVPNRFDGYHQGIETKFGGNALLSNKFIQPSAPVPGFTNFWNYEMYKTVSGAPTPVITDPATWGTRNDSLLTELMTSSDATSPCGYGVDGTIIPRKVNQKWDYSVLHVTGFFTAPSSGEYVFETSSDDGMQFKINDTLIINKPGFSSSGGGQSTGITLVENTKYPIELLWTNGTGGSHCCFTHLYVDEVDLMPETLFNSLCSPS